MFPFRQFGAIGGDEQGKMGELGRRGAEAFKDEQMLEGVGQVILAADNVADAEIGVVGARGEMVSGKAVRPQQGEVLYLVGELWLRAVDAVHKSQHTALAAGHAIAQRKRLACGGAAVGLFARHLAHAGIREPGALRGGLMSSSEWAGVKSR